MARPHCARTARHIRWICRRNSRPVCRRQNRLTPDLFRRLNCQAVAPRRLPQRLSRHRNQPSGPSNVEQRHSRTRRFQVQVPPSRFAQHPPPAGAQDQPSWIRYGSITSSSVSRASARAAASVSTPTGPPGMVVGDAAQITAVHRIQPQTIDLQPVQRGVGDGAIHRRIALHRGKITHPAQQAPGDARRPARPAGDFGGPLLGQTQARAAARRGR